MPIAPPGSATVYSRLRWSDGEDDADVDAIDYHNNDHHHHGLDNDNDDYHNDDGSRNVVMMMLVCITSHKTMNVVIHIVS